MSKSADRITVIALGGRAMRSTIATALFEPPPLRRRILLRDILPHEDSDAPPRTAREQLETILQAIPPGPVVLVSGDSRAWILRLPELARAIPTQCLHVVVRTPFPFESPLSLEEENALERTAFLARAVVEIPGRDLEAELAPNATLRDAFSLVDERTARVVADLVAVLRSPRRSRARKALAGVFHWAGTERSARPAWTHLVGLRWILREDRLPEDGGILVVRGSRDEEASMRRALRRLGWKRAPLATIPDTPRFRWASRFVRTRL